jgi:hypothetical protein
MPDLFAGGRYIQERGFSTREIEAVHGDDIHWRDKFGSGQCSRRSFRRWLGKGDLAPDSPPPPKTPRKRSQPITEAFFGRLNQEIIPLRKLATLEMESENAEKRALIGISIWSIREAVSHMDEQVKRTWAPGLQRLTRMDLSAETLQRLIPSLIETLTPSGTPLEAVSPQLLQALSDGLESVNRLRGDLAPYLGQ